MLFYPAALPLSRQTLNYAAGVIGRHRRQIGSCWRKLNPGRQALLVLAYLRKGQAFAELAAGFGISTATAWRYVTETVALLAARAPALRRALAGAKKDRHAYLVIDGTLIPINRVAADRPFYSGKHRRRGMNLQVIASPNGEILWVSGALPGAVHDLTADMAASLQTRGRPRSATDSPPCRRHADEDASWQVEHLYGNRVIRSGLAASLCRPPGTAWLRGRHGCILPGCCLGQRRSTRLLIRTDSLVLCQCTAAVRPNSPGHMAWLTAPARYRIRLAPGSRSPAGRRGSPRWQWSA